MQKLEGGKSQIEQKIETSKGKNFQKNIWQECYIDKVMANLRICRYKLEYFSYFFFLLVAFSFLGLAKRE